MFFLLAEANDLNRRRIYLMPQKYELIHSASSTSSLFIYRRVFVPLCSSKMPSVLLGAKRIPCSSTAGRVEPQLNGFYEGIPDKHPKGKSQLNGLEGGFEPDLNYFFPSQCDRIPWNGVRFQGAFEFDSFRSRNAVNLRIFKIDSFFFAIFAV